MGLEGDVFGVRSQQLFELRQRKCLCILQDA